MTDPLLAMSDVHKSFGGVRALAGADLSVRAGEIHALLGENGAGKSTLMKILSGAIRPDAGRIALDGVNTTLPSRAESRAVGIAMAFQHPHLIGNLSIADNVALGRERSRWGFVNRVSAQESAREALARLGWAVDPRRLAGRVTPGQAQLIDIARALAQQPRVLVLDEPTASLDVSQVESLFKVVREIADGGCAVVYISHRLEEVVDLCHRATVLRDGRTVTTVDLSETSPAHLVRLMVGRDVDLSARRKSTVTPNVRLKVTGLGSQEGLNNADLVLHAGEVVGVYGLLGSGRTELVRALLGADKVIEGTVELDGRLLTRLTPSRAVRHGIGVVPEDRSQDGCLLPLSVGFNLTLPGLRGTARHGWRRPRVERRIASRAVEVLQIRTRGLQAPVETLSGGNQQKVVFGRWLDQDLQLLLLDDPTVGVDVGAKSEIHALISQLAAQGAAVLLASSELPELLSLADRLIIMRAGRTIAELAGPTMTEENALSLALGGTNVAH